MKLYKKSFKGIALAAFSVLALSACSDWTDSESIKLKEPGIDEQSPELYAKYLKNLQEYKNSDHKIVYGWFDNSESSFQPRAAHVGCSRQPGRNYRNYSRFGGIRIGRYCKCT